MADKQRPTPITVHPPDRHGDRAALIRALAIMIARLAKEQQTQATKKAA